MDFLVSSMAMKPETSLRAPRLWNSAIRTLISESLCTHLLNAAVIHGRSASTKGQLPLLGVHLMRCPTFVGLTRSEQYDAPAYCDMNKRLS
jgi:hypothetical protein